MTRVALLLFLLLLSAFFSAAETAFTSISFLQIQDLKKRRPRKGRRIEKLRARSDIFLTTILIGNNLVNITASAVATEMTIHAFGSSLIGVSTGVVTLVVLIFGEVTPKRLAMGHNETICVHTVEIIFVLSWVLQPVIFLIGAVSFFLTRLFGPARGQRLTLDGVLHVVDLAEDTGVLENDKTRMMRSILRFSEVTVNTIMTHRMDVFSLSAGETVEAAIGRVHREGYSRIPVYEGDPENIVGVVLGMDIWKAHHQGRGDTPLRRLMIPPVFVPQNLSVYRLLSILKKEKLNLVVVLDEYGGLAGIVTYEDLIEEILGEIYDEDEEKDGEKIRPNPDGSYQIQGDTPLYRINDLLDTRFPIRKGRQTLSGFLLERAGNIPRKDEEVATGEGVFIIETVHRERIVSVRFVPAPREDA